MNRNVTVSLLIIVSSDVILAIKISVTWNSSIIFLTLS